MSLPTRTTVEDIQMLCNYFAKKPMGATVKEAKAVLDVKLLDPKKIAAMKSWGLLIEQDNRLKASPECRTIAKDNGANREPVLAGIIQKTPAYKAIIERALHRREKYLNSTDVGAHWDDHFKGEVSINEEVLIEQVTCFFYIAEGAGFGAFVVGRKGAATRFEFNQEKIASALEEFPQEEVLEDTSKVMPKRKDEEDVVFTEPEEEFHEKELGQGIFIAHGKNKKPLEQLKKILDQFKIPYKVAIDEPNLGRPIGGKIREVMQACNCAILIFTADEELKDKEGKILWRPSENVVYELGASGYLYDNRIVIMKESSVVFPSNFQDIGYIAFEKDELEAKAMEILRELIGFGIVKVST